MRSCVVNRVSQRRHTRRRRMPSPLVREAAGRLLRRYKLLRSAEVANISELKSIDVLLTRYGREHIVWATSGTRA